MKGTDNNLTLEEEHQNQQKIIENDLFERKLYLIQNKFHLDYLSDIPDPRYHTTIFQYLESLDVDTFPLVIWEKLLSYLMGEELNFDSLEDVDVFIKKEKF